MKKELKNYRIVSENGEALLISKERFSHLLETLDLLAKSDCGDRRRGSRKRSAVAGD